MILSDSWLENQEFEMKLIAIFKHIVWGLYSGGLIFGGGLIFRGHLVLVFTNKDFKIQYYTNNHISKDIKGKIDNF